MNQHTQEFLLRLQKQFDACALLDVKVREPGVTMSTREAQVQATTVLIDMIAGEVDGLAEKLVLADGQIVKLRTALNQIAYPKTYKTDGLDPAVIAKDALFIGSR